MTIVVRNDEHNIKVIYEDVEHVIHGLEWTGTFGLIFENGEAATFPYKDDDGSEWNCYRIH